MSEILLKPILKSVTPFDANIEKRFDFSATGSTQFSRINYVVETNSTGAVIADVVVNTYQFYFVVAAGTFTNGTEYRVKVRVGDSSGNYGEFSDYVVFTCLSPAVVTITTFASSAVIGNQSILLEGSFSQAQGDSVASYRFIVYDESGVAILAQPETYSQTISYLASGFQSGKTYYVELIVTSQAGVTTTSGRVQAVANFIQPVVHSVIELSNTGDGKVKITAVLSQVRGIANEYCTFYPADDPEYLDMTGNSKALLYINEGLNTVTDDFTLEVRCLGTTPLIRIHGEDSLLMVMYDGERFVAIKTVGQISSRYTSEAVDVADIEYTLAILNNNGRVDLYVKECG